MSSSVISQQDLEYLLINTKMSRQEIETQAKAFQKLAPSGKIELKKLEELFPLEIMKFFLNAADENHDKQLDVREYIMLISFSDAAILGTDSGMQRYFKFLFRVFDINNDGQISKSEFKKILAAFCDSGLVPKEVNRRSSDIFKDLDENHDSYISLDEFVNRFMEVLTGAK